MTDWVSWAISTAVAAATGFIAAVATSYSAITRFEGSVDATLKAHDQRLTTLESDIRYEIRALRDRVEATSSNIHALRNELMAVLNRRNGE